MRLPVGFGQARTTKQLPVMTTFRKQVGTLIARELGAKVAKDQLGHANEVTTETFYIAQSVDAPKVSELIETFIRDSAPTG